MKKLLLIPAILVLFSLTAFAAPKVTEIAILSPFGSSKLAVEEFVANFNATTGKANNWHFTMTTHIDDYTQVMDLAFQSGEMPDIVYAASGLMIKYARQGVYTAYEDLPGWQDELKRFKPYMQPLLNQVDGKTYSLPFEVLTYKMCYNKDLFKKAGIVDAKGNATPPKTWAEVTDYAKRITAIGGGKQYGVIWPMKFVVWADWHIFKPFVASIGHEAFDQKSGTYKFADFKPALDWMMKIKADKSYFPGPENLDIDPGRAQFAEGNGGMIIGLTFDVGVYTYQFPAKCDWDTADLPVLDTSKRYMEPMLSRGSWVATKAARSDKNKLAAVASFLKEWNSDKSLRLWYGLALYVPYKPEIIAMPGVVPALKGWAGFANISKGFIQATPPDSSLELEGLTAEDVVRKIFSGQVGVKEALADLDTRYNAALKNAIADKKVILSQYTVPNYDISVK
jgi:multiple sugar transport system substrate-binding protein